MKKTNIFRTIKVIVLIIVVFVLIGLVSVIYELSTIEIEFDKNYETIVIKPGQIIDHRDFEQPDTFELKQIDIGIRLRMSEFMKKNNLKLKAGKYDFNSVNETYEKMLLSFKFEKKE